MPTIVHIAVAGPESKARRLSFDDTTERTTSAAVVKALGLEVGSSTDDQELLEQEREFARERALRVLGYRERSESELRQKLLDSGYPQQVTDAVVSRMAELGMVDDRRFAAMWVRTRISSGFGRRRIERELGSRGIDAQIVAEAFAAVDDHDEVEDAVASLRGRTPRDPKERERLLRRLITRGYAMSTALEALDRIGCHPADEQDSGSDQQ